MARPVHTTTSGPVDSPHLPASKSLGPGYDHERFVEATRTTYANAENWKYSLAILLSEDSVRARIAQLRLDGWLDWHIVGALINVALQWRLSHLGIDVEKIDPSSEPDFLRRAELADEPPMPLPIDLATIDHHLYLHAVNVGLRWGLYPLPEHESANSLRALLERRYRFADVDVPHRDLLSALDSDGQPPPSRREHVSSPGTPSSDAGTPRTQVIGPATSAVRTICHTPLHGGRTLHGGRA